MIGRTLILKTSAWKPVERLVRKSFLFRPLVKRFIAGDTLEQALPVCEDLVKRGFFVSLDLLGENTSSEAEALKAKDEYIRMLNSISASAAHQPKEPVPFPPGKPAPGNGSVESCNISIKLTQCGLDQGVDFAQKNLHEVLRVAQAHQSFVRVDMEASAYTEKTVEIVSRAVKEFDNTGFVFQSYLKRTDSDVQLAIDLKARVRIVKGAYLEPPEVAFQEKKTVDDQYIAQAKRLLKEGFYPAIATHDQRIIEALKVYVAEEKIEPRSFEFQMLFGIRRDLQERLLQEGFNVRVYVPFGNSWYPYFTRRLAERPANFFFILKSMFKG